MQRGTAGSQFEHIAEHRDPPAARPDRRMAEHVQRRRHRGRIGIVAFVDQDGLAARNAEPAPHAAARRRLDLRQRQRGAREVGADQRRAASTASEFIAMWRPGMPSL